MDMIDLSKQYTNHVKDEIKLSHIDRGIVYGWVKQGIDWFSHQWKEEGGFVINDSEVYHLVEVKEKKIIKKWININDDGSTNTCGTKELANYLANRDRIACKEIEIEYYEGEGL